MLFFKQCPVSYNTPYEKIGDEVRSLADEVPFDIPDSWEWVRLGNIGDWGAGATPSRTNPEYYGGNIPWLKTGDLTDSYIDAIPETITELALEKTSVRLNPAGSVLIAMYGATIGKLGILSIAATTNQACCACFPLGGLDNKYLFYFLMAQKPLFIKQGEGGAQPNISKEKIVSTLMPVPPLEEQRRIVVMLGQIFPIIDAYSKCKTELDLCNATFPERLKKSILQEAVQGKLVPQDQSDEPAEALLERIRTEKQRLIKEGKIKKDKHESVIFRRDNSHYEKRGSKEENINDIIPFELPDSWEWIRLSAILTSTDAGKSPQCENRPRTIGEWGVIKTTAIQDGYFLAEENKGLPLDFNLQESMVVHHGDLLITRAGPRNRTGVICVVDGEPENLILSDKTVRLSYLRNFVNPHYVMTALSSPAMQYFVVDAMTGMASSQVNISQEKMKTFLLPLPPLNEQQRIVDEVSKIFGRIDKLNF